MNAMTAGWYRSGNSRERFHDGSQFTGETRGQGEKTPDRFPLFIWEDGEVVPGPSSHPHLDQYKQPGWRQASVSRFSIITYSIMALAIAAFALWLALQ